MLKHPLARTVGLSATQCDDGLLVRDADGTEIARLSDLEARVWRAADGRTSVSELALRLAPNEGGAEALWRALDHLADLGLLEARPSPPGSLADPSRRKVLARVAAGSLAAVAVHRALLGSSSAAATAYGSAHTGSPELASGKGTRVAAVMPKHRGAPHGHGGHHRPRNDEIIHRQGENLRKGA